MKAAIIGHPVAHSKSPIIHRYWMDKYNVPGEYIAIDAAPEDLGAIVQRLREEGYAGFNLTVPHKEAMLDLCDEIDDTACAIGAVNTVVIKDSKICGMNTDAFGFIENIKIAARKQNFGWDIQEGPAVILGAGGAARAVLYALIEAGAPQILLANRTREKAEKLAQIFGKSIVVADWEERSAILKEANLLVNTTSLGLQGQKPLEIDLHLLPLGALVHDIVYAPLETPLLKRAVERGNHVVSGIGMLLYQAQPAFEAWSGVKPDVDGTLKNLVLA